MEDEEMAEDKEMEKEMDYEITPRVLTGFRIQYLYINSKPNKK